MNTATVFSRARLGMDAPLVLVEVHLSKGLPGFSIVGLAQTAVKESRDRVRSAIINSGFEMPARKIIVNLSPADLPKEGSRFDLPIAIGILAASGQLPVECLESLEFAAELSINGALRPIHSLLAFALATEKAGRTLICAQGNAAEAALAHPGVRCAPHLMAIVQHLNQTNVLPAVALPTVSVKPNQWDIGDIQGQALAKRALLIAAAGGHSLLMSGPPGSGKSMLAQRLPGLLPLLSAQEALEVAVMQSLSVQGFHVAQWGVRPFRSPHHTISPVALVGGGSIPRPGEMSMAHRGVLFLDELPEFPRKVIETLRQPLESRQVHIARAQQSVIFPADFQLIAAMNPCPCGYMGDAEVLCRCSPQQIEQYQAKISGPILDRIDLHLTVARLPAQALLRRTQMADEPESPRYRAQVEAAQQRQRARFGGLNAGLSNTQIQALPMSSTAQEALLALVENLRLSARAFYRIWKVARTLADLDGQEVIDKIHVLEAGQYRQPFHRE